MEIGPENGFGLLSQRQVEFFGNTIQMVKNYLVFIGGLDCALSETMFPAAFDQRNIRVISRISGAQF